MIFFLVGLPELETADLECFLEKKGLSPLGVKMSFLLSKNCLCLWISATFIVENIFFLNIPYLLWVWDIVDMYLSHLGTRIKSCTIYATYFLGLQNSDVLHCHKEKTFFINFELYDLANGKEWLSKIWWTCRHTS
jgi:hypothetical protein